MKKGIIFSIFALGILVFPVFSHAQVPVVTPLAPLEKPTLAPIDPSGNPPVEVLGEEVIDMNALKFQPLTIRRQVVSTQLDNIRGRLVGIYDKTGLALIRLADNDIDTSSSETELALAATSLADAKLTIDALITASYDPANNKPVPILINGSSFKDAVLKAELSLRTAREHIITSLTSLKTAVNLSTATQE